MGAPLILSKNRNNSPENSNPPAVEEQTQTEITEHEEDIAVNGKLDINIIKDNSIYEKPENNTPINTYSPTNTHAQSKYHQLNDFKHNYHWFIESSAHKSHMLLIMYKVDWIIMKKKYLFLKCNHVNIIVQSNYQLSQH